MVHVLILMAASKALLVQCLFGLLFVFLVDWRAANLWCHCRANLEFEKKAKPELTAQVQAMEKDLVAMAQEAEKLRADISKRNTPSKAMFQSREINFSSFF
jgi:hypothetical protein